MASSVKIGVIGAGSAVFAAGLVNDLCRTESLAGSQVTLMDIDPDRLALTHELAVRFADELGVDYAFEKTTDRQAALEDADFVINMAYVKGHGHEWAMRDVAAEHGYYYDGVNLGDYYQLRLIMDIARDMEELCPDAWLLQSANPVFNCCTLANRETSIKVCGLCHGHEGYREVAEMIGLDPDRVTWQAPGFNHNIWLTHFLYEGENAYPLLDAWIENEAEEYWEAHEQTMPHDIQMSRAAVHQYRMYGLFPIGDTVRRVGAGYTVGCTVRRGEWWYHTDIETKKHWFGEPWGGPDTELGRPAFEEILEAQMEMVAAVLEDPGASLADLAVQMLGGETMTGEQIVPIVDALVNDGRGEFQVNVPNRGAIDGIPHDVVVEVPAVVSGKGIQPIHVGSLPPKVMLEAIMPHWLDMERNLLAFKTGDRSILLWNALDSHQTRSYERGLSVMEELLELEGHEEMDEHFEWPSNW